MSRLEQRHATASEVPQLHDGNHIYRIPNATRKDDTMDTRITVTVETSEEVAVHEVRVATWLNADNPDGGMAHLPEASNADLMVLALSAVESIAERIDRPVPMVLSLMASWSEACKEEA